MASEERQRGDFVAGMMSLRQGRHWIHNFLSACHIFDDPFTGQALHEAYLKGERNVGSRLLADVMKYALNDYVKMMDEANVRSTISELSRSSIPDGGDTGPIDDYPEPGTQADFFDDSGTNLWGPEADGGQTSH